MNIQEQQSPTLDASDIQENSSMGTVMAFAGTLLSLEVVGGLNGGIDMPVAQNLAPAPDVGINFEFGSPATPSLRA